MTRIELLKIVVGQARANGFEFRRWYTGRLGLPWINAEAAFALLDAQRRYYSLLFSHEFACTFWKPGAEITFQVERQTFQRVMPDGSIATVTRKPFTRRSARPDVWRYHLRQMAVSEDPLRYLRKYLRVEDELVEASRTEDASPKPTHLPKRASHNAGPGLKSVKRSSRPLSAELPAFLRRPYP